MTTGSDAATAGAQGKAGWIELMRGGRAVHTAMLNLGIGLHALDIFVMTTIMPAVVADIGGLTYYTWTSMLYMVGSIVGAASGAHLRARLGRRRGYVWAGAVLLAGTVGCAVPPDMATLLAARVVKGFGGGLVIAQSMALVSELYDNRLRTRILALITGTWSVAALIGPAIGGVFGEIDWWRGAFWATVPLVLLFMAVAWHTLPDGTAEAPGRRLPWRRLMLLALGVMAVGVTGQFRQPFAVAALILAAGALVWLSFRLDAASDHGLFPSRPLSLAAPVGLAYWVYFLISFTHSALLVFAPLFLQVLHGIPPLWIGYLALVFSLGWTAGSVGVSGWSGRGERLAATGGMVLAAAAIAIFAAATVSGSLWIITVSIAAAGLGIGATNVQMTAFGMAVARRGEESVTASSMPTVRSLGVAFGAAAAGLVANAAGLDQGASPATLLRVAAWVLGLTALVPALTAVITLRAYRLGARAAAG